LPALRSQGNLQADHRRQLGRAEPGGENQAGAVMACVGGVDAERGAPALHCDDPLAVFDPPALGFKALVQTTQQAEGIDVSIGGRIATTGNIRSKSRQHLG
jgi:hypothetical protein